MFKILYFKILRKKFKTLFFVIITISLIYIPFVFENKLFSNNFKSPKYPNSNDTIIVYDTVYEYDTIYIYETIYDTVFVYDTLHLEITEPVDSINNLKDSTLSINDLDTASLPPDYLSNIKFKIGFCFGIFSNIDFITHKNIENKEFNQLFVSSFKPNLCNSYGINFETFYKNTFFETGINKTILRENFDFNYQKLNIELNPYFRYFQNTNTEIDTIYFLDLDAYLQGDTVWIPFKDTTYNYFKDSVLTNNYNTTTSETKNQNINKYYYTEIPIIFGYQLEKNKYNFGIKSGIIFGKIRKIEGNSFVYKNDYQITDIKNVAQFPKTTYYLYSSFYYEYKINPRLSIFSECFFKQNLNTIYTGYQLSKNFFSFGVTFGINLNFNVKKNKKFRNIKI